MVKKYEIDRYHGVPVESETGQWTKTSDYEKLEAERDRYKTFWDWARETDKMLFESDMKAKQALQEG